MKNIRYKFLLLLIIPMQMLSCKKEKETAFPPPTTPPNQMVLLKDIVVPNLPSPYYQFKYLSTGKMIFASFASGFKMYNFEYNGDRLTEMRNDNAVNKDRLHYIYDNEGRVAIITYADFTDQVYTIIELTYNGQQLVKLEREQKLNVDFFIDKTIQFQYYPDGNLRELSTHRTPGNGNAETTITDQFEQYDNKINVDGFNLLHDEFLDHLVLLPGVQFQKNNPGKIIHTGDGDNYKIAYTYTYNDKNAPLTKTGTGTWLNGPNEGNSFQSNAFYSYY